MIFLDGVYLSGPHCPRFDRSEAFPRSCFHNLQLELTEQKMAAQEVVEAEQMLTDWKRDHCERGLVGTRESPQDELTETGRLWSVSNRLD